MKRFTFTISRTWLPILAVLALAFVFSQYSIEANAVTIAAGSTTDCCAPCDPSDCPMPCDPSDCPPGCCAVGASFEFTPTVAATSIGCEASCGVAASSGCTPCPVSCTRATGVAKTSEVARLN